MKDYYQTYENATKCPWQVYSKNSLLVNSFLHILFQHYLPVTVRGWDLFDNAYDDDLWSQRPSCLQNSEKWLLSLPLWYSSSTTMTWQQRHHSYPWTETFSSIACLKSVWTSSRYSTPLVSQLEIMNDRLPRSNDAPPMRLQDDNRHSVRYPLYYTQLWVFKEHGQCEWSPSLVTLPFI